MIKYESWIEACKELELDPEKFGDNGLLANSHILGANNDSFDLESINFPEEESQQVKGIGQIIYNLVSQTIFPPIYDLISDKGKADYNRNKKIKKIMPLLVKSLNFWLESGLKKSESSIKLLSYHGKIYEINPDYNQKVIKMNDDMAKVHDDYLRKSQASVEHARKIILD